MLAYPHSPSRHLLETPRFPGLHLGPAGREGASGLPGPTPVLSVLRSLPLGGVCTCYLGDSMEAGLGVIGLGGKKIRCHLEAGVWAAERMSSPAACDRCSGSMYPSTAAGR